MVGRPAQAATMPQPRSRHRADRQVAAIAPTGRKGSLPAYRDAGITDALSFNDEATF
jgi:hypothetical protein